MAEVLWYYAKNDQQLGPVSPAELKQLAATRVIAPEDLLWREGMESWAPAGRVKGLFPERQEQTPPPTASDSQEAPPPAAAPDASSATPRNFAEPALGNDVTPPEATVAVTERTAARPQRPAQTTSAPGHDALWLAQVTLWGICIAAIFIGGMLLTVKLLSAATDAEKTALAVSYGAFFLAAYFVASAGERIAALVQFYFDRRRKP